MAGMLKELTWTYWASISAARAPNGLFGLNFFSFVAPFWVKFYFGPKIGMWGVQSVAMERPTHRALFQPIWNHPAGKKVKKVIRGPLGHLRFWRFSNIHKNKILGVKSHPVVKIDPKMATMHPMRSNLLVWGQKNKFGTACSKSHFFKRNDPIFLTWNEPIEKKNYGEAIFLRIKAHCSARSGCKSWT